jgi:small-conductance mechanosensitive channel
MVMVEWLRSLETGLSPALMHRLVLTTIVLLTLWLARRVATRALRRKTIELTRYHFWRRVVGYSQGALVLVLLGVIWIRGGESLATVLGLASAGIAVAMHDTIANVAGWIFIVWRRPFRVGDRIQIAQIAGDVIDIRPFQFSVIEIGNWVDADQSTGRIVHVPNSQVLREPLANYVTGFEYIWHEIPVLITFESNWEEAKAILERIANEKTTHLSEGAEAEIRRAAMSYLIYFRNLTPIVYTTVKDSGVLLTIRFIVQPRARRGSEQIVWEAILREFAKHPDIELAYPTVRYYRGEETRG